MPNLNGLDAARKLRERYGNGFKIYLITGNVLFEHPEEFKVFNGVLNKPCSRKELSAILHSAQESTI